MTHPKEPLELGPVAGEVVGRVVDDESDLRRALGVVNQSGVEADHDLVTLWLHEKGARTRHVYEPIVVDFLDHLARDGRTLRTCTVLALQRWRDGIDGKPRTVRLHLAAVKSLLSFAHKTGYTLFNVGPVVQSPRLPDDVTDRILTREEVFRLFAAATPRAEPLFRLAYYTGARIEELCGLQWRHVRFIDDGGAVVTLHGKGDKVRHVRLKPAHANVLRELVPSAEGGYGDRFVFETRTGRPLHPDEANNMLKRAAMKAGVQPRPVRSRGEVDTSADAERMTSRVSMHWFRHSHATHALEGGAPIHLVKATLGHASLGTTGMYLHANPDDASGKYLGD